MDLVQIQSQIIFKDSLIHCKIRPDQDSHDNNIWWRNIQLSKRKESITKGKNI